MLKSLEIKNYAIIERVHLELDKGLNILTGETGAGKSIIIGALGLITGTRVDKSVLYNQDEKCIIEGHFILSNDHLKAYFEAKDIDYNEGYCLIRREILANGRSRAFINDTPVKLDHLKYVGEQFIDIHAQHKILELTDNQYQIDLIDQFGENVSLLNKYKDKYQSYLQQQKLITELIAEGNKSKADADYWQFQLSEFDEINLKKDEQEGSEIELNKLNNAEQIKTVLADSIHKLMQDESSIINHLNTISNQLEEIGGFHENLPDLMQRIKSTRIELEDIEQDLSDIDSEIIYDSERINEIESRLNNIYRLQNKHQVNSIEALLEQESIIRKKVNSIENIDEEILKLQKQIEDSEKELLNIATKLHQERTKASKKMQLFINELLPNLGMQFAQFKIDVELSPTKTLNKNGLDTILFLLSPDKGGHYLPLGKSASGGELSRIMLSIKHLTAQNSPVESIVFDEIDTGISGDIAGKVGELIEELSNKVQITCITHLPQIACKGESHYFVSKRMENNKTISEIKKLDAKERVNELAIMLSNNKPSKIAIQNAQELLKN